MERDAWTFTVPRYTTSDKVSDARTFRYVRSAPFASVARVASKPTSAVCSSSNSTARISLRSSSASSSRADAVIHGVRPFALSAATRPVPTAMFPNRPRWSASPATPLARRFESPQPPRRRWRTPPAETPATPVCNPDATPSATVWIPAPNARRTFGRTRPEAAPGGRAPTPSASPRGCSPQRARAASGSGTGDFKDECRT